MNKQASVVVLPVSAGRLSDSSQEEVEAPEAQRLARVVAKVRVDARERAPHYQDDTVVPEGGE
jgi:hypothetical protein